MSLHEFDSKTWRTTVIAISKPVSCQFLSYEYIFQFVIWEKKNFLISVLFNFASTSKAKEFARSTIRYETQSSSYLNLRQEEGTNERGGNWKSDDFFSLENQVASIAGKASYSSEFVFSSWRMEMFLSHLIVGHKSKSGGLCVRLGVAFFVLGSKTSLETFVNGSI